MFLKVKLKYDFKHYSIFNEFCVIADRTTIGNALDTAGVLMVARTFNVLLRRFITYVLKNPETKQVYIGRTSGFGEPLKILKRRMYGHAYKKRGFKNPKIDKAMQGLNARSAIRGREQQLIDFYSGIGSFNVANIRRGVAKKNPFRNIFHHASNTNFGYLANYTGKK